MLHTRSLSCSYCTPTVFSFILFHPEQTAHIIKNSRMWRHCGDTGTETCALSHTLAGGPAAIFPFGILSNTFNKCTI